ncbi:MAG: serine/threonine protein kinase [Myxococcota bacterium]
MATTNTSKVPLGTVLEGKFRITREIGRGGMAAVYEAENVDIGKRVAVKILAAELITSRVVRERFIREARAAASIRSPYICDVYDSGMYEDRPFLVMELLEGESLYDMMTRVRQLDAQTTLRVATHTARGLAKAHEANIVHRDLKPENIFLTTDEEGHLLAKIVDFGLAKFYESTGTDAQSVRLTREGALFGTPAYMSPEQAKGQGEVDHRADLWALGCIVYECLTGQTVWSVEQGVAMILAQIANSPLPKPSKLRPDLPASFERWFERALNRDATKRFQTAKEFAESLQEALYPKDGDLRAPVVSSDTEGADEGAEARTNSERPIALVAARAEEPSGHDPSSPPPGAREPMVLSTEPPGARSGSLRAVSVLMVLAAVALGGYATWLYLLHPPGKPAERPAAANVPRVTPSARPTKKTPKAEPSAVADVEMEAYAKKIGEAQELLLTEPGRAVDAFRAAFQDGAKPAARSLLSHASVAVEEASKCKVTGVSRPRPFQLDVPVSRPSIAYTSRGAVFSWVDNHQDSRRRQAFTVLLDSAMRRVTAPISVTPEAQNVRQYQLLQVGDKLALIYWDEGREPGVYGRILDAEGKIATSLRKLSSNRKGDYAPSLAAGANDDFWAAWEEEFENGASDVVVRHLKADLEPFGPSTRITALKPPSGATRQPRTPALFVDSNQLQVAFARDLGGQRIQMMLQTIALNDPELSSGVPRKLPKGQKPQKGDEVLGTLKALNSPGNRNTPPHITCGDEGCFIAWDEDKTGGFVSFVDRERGPLWHRTFAGKGAGPALGRDERSAVVAWFEGARLKLASVTRDGVGAASVVSRVSGIQPAPDVVRGSKPGEWYIAFRDYEAAHLEVFAARAECP